MTLKVSTIEQTASSVDATGGKGNPALVSWDFGREITVNLEDALFSPASMAVMFGDKDGVSVSAAKEDVTKMTMTRVPSTISDTKVFLDSKGGRIEVKLLNGDAYYKDEENGVKVTKVLKDDGKTAVEFANFSTDLKTGDKIFVEYTVSAITKKIDVNADTFPGTYRIVGDTFARSDVTGEDEYFQFVIPKAKLQSDQTITLEAEGDPSVFSMSLKVLRPESGPMMQLIQYNL